MCNLYWLIEVTIELFLFIFVCLIFFVGAGGAWEYYYLKNILPCKMQTNIK